MASGAFTDVLSMTSRARCITPCSDDGWQHDCSVTGLASSAYTASDETYTTCAGGPLPRAWQTTSPILTLAVTSAATRAGAIAETNTTLSVLRIRPPIRLAASGASKSHSFRVTGRLATPSVASRRAMAPPTKPPAPRTTTRDGRAGRGFRCSSITRAFGLGARERRAWHSRVQPRRRRYHPARETDREPFDLASRRPDRPASALETPPMAS